MPTSVDQPQPDTAVVDRMDELFERKGFAGTSVDDLRDAAAVSLRTLYRRYRSREEMIVAVLHNRAGKYLGHLAGAGGVTETFERIASFGDGSKPLGCLFLRARADHPDHPAIEQEVIDYHRNLRALLSAAAEVDGLGEHVDEILVLHEGLHAAAPVIGLKAAYENTMRCLARIRGDHR